jgi:hypothetical protein
MPSRKLMNGRADIVKFMNIDSASVRLVNGLENFSGNFERTDSFSVELWFNASAARPTALIGHAADAPTRRGWFISAFGSRTSYTMIGIALVSNEATNNFINVLTTISSFSTNVWHHVVVTYNGSSAASGIKCYINNSSRTFTVVQNTLTGTILNTEKLWIGRSYAYGYFPGKVDDVVIYPRVLSASEASQRYNGGAGTESVFGTTYLQYHLNEASGSIVTDSSADARNGITVNDPSWIAGKLNNCLQLNGSSQYIEI